jgi:hypothetical protein
MAEAKSFADKAVDLLLRSLRTVFNERVVLAVEKLIVQTRENFIGQDVLLEPTVIFTGDRKINTKSTLPWMLSNEEKAKMGFASIDFASQNALGVGSAESEEVDIEAMINATKKALNFLQKQVRVQSASLNSFAKTKKGELEQVRKERAIEKERLREEALLAKSLEEAAKKSAEIPVELVDSIEVSEIIIPEKLVEIAKEVPTEPEISQVPPSIEAQFADEPSKQAKPAKPQRVVEPPKPPKVKRTFSDGDKRKVGLLVVVAVMATVLFALFPQIKSGFSSGNNLLSSKSAKEATPTPTTTQMDNSSPTPTPTTTQMDNSSPTPTPTTTQMDNSSPTPTKTKTVNSRLLTDSARSAVVASLEKCALSTVYSPPRCPFEETAFIHGTSMYWTLSGVPKITLVSNNSEVLTLLVSGKAIAHVYYGEKLRNVDNPFSRKAIATPSGDTYTIKWK